MTSPPADPITAALQQVLAREHAAVYGYPLIGVRLAEQSQINRARDLEAAHRLTRDAISSQLVARHATPAAAEASYSAANPVTDPAGAQRWAVQLEADCAAGYRFLLAVTATGAGQSTGTAGAILRSQALAGLAAAAQQATRWRLLVDPGLPTVPFPGV
jgi:hypothetical protein